MLGVWARLADFDFGNQIITRGFHLNGSFSLVCKKAIWGCGVGLGRLGVAGGLVRGSTASLGPIGRFRFGRQINTVFSFKWSWCGMCHWEPHVCFFLGIEAWKGGQNPEGGFDRRGRSIGGLR